MYNSDGLPIWYVNVSENKNLMREMKQSVFNHLSNFGKDSALNICSILDIHPAFEPDVDGFIEEWERV